MAQPTSPATCSSSACRSTTSSSSRSIFTAFVVPLKYQHRVLFYGILGAIVFRATFIGLGAAIIETFHWAIYVFGFLLLYTGYRMWAHRNDHMIDPTNNALLRLFRRFVPTTDGYREQRFVVVENGRRLATPLLAVLLVVESSDILFAIDSVPAIFSVTTDTFLVFSSNAFAILGLRSLYFLLAGAVDKFRYLKPGLAALLIFAGLKILLADIMPIPIPLSLAIIIAILAIAIGASLVADRRDRRLQVADSTAHPEGTPEEVDAIHRRLTPSHRSPGRSARGRDTAPWGATR